MSAAQNLMKHLLRLFITEGVPEDGFRIQEIIENGRNLGLSEEEAQEAIRNLKHQGSVYEPRPGLLRPLDLDFPKTKEENHEKKHNLKYENAEIHFRIEKVIRKLHDLIETPLHGDGEDRVYERQIEIKTTLFSAHNYIHEQNRTYRSASTIIFYRTNHQELLRTNGSYIIVIYSLNGNFINIHAQKQIPARDIDPLIVKSMSREKIGIRWTRFFKEVSEEPIFRIPKEEITMNCSKCKKSENFCSRIILNAYKRIKKGGKHMERELEELEDLISHVRSRNLEERKEREEVNN